MLGEKFPDRHKRIRRRSVHDVDETNSEFVGSERKATT